MRRIRLVLVIAILAVASGCGGGASQSFQTAPPATLTANPASISFGSVAVGTTSTIENVTLSASGGSVSVTAITPQAPFVVSNVAPSLPATVSSTQSLTFQVAFAPTTSGAVNSSTGVSVVSNASNSPTNITLSGTGTTGLSVSTTSVNFGNVTVGTTSPTQNITLTASGQAFNISSIALSSQTPFKLVSAPTGTLNANTSETVQVSFAPTATGAASGTLTVMSNAPNSPNTISLSGTGTTGTSSACLGTAIDQSPTIVTSLLSSVGAGITVTEATSLQGNGAGSWNTYADLPTYSTPANVVIYNYGTSPNAVASAKLDGTGAQVISGSAQGTQAQVTPDGLFAFYEGQNPSDTADIYAVPISQSGNCVQNRLSNLSLTPIAPAGALIISNASLDSTAGHNVIAFSDGLVVHRVYDDGTLLSPDPITLPDPENADVLHRMRLNPVFPNIMWYKRDAPAPNPSGTAQTEIWVIDLNNPGTVHSLSGSTGPTSPAIDHASWSNDGTKLGYIYQGYWWVANVLNSDGTFNFNASNTFTLTQIGPPSTSGLTVDFCNLSPDSSVYVCAQGGTEIYLMSPDGSQTKDLVNPEATGSIYNGIPKPLFLDLEHILYSSDFSGLPQIYILTGFTTTFP